ncbi:Cation-independent mannose-6-phosphate receptor CI-MPR [Peltigera leucophlebia]|nr:Cation-independent mannose-6-phosphate receptor CI-MPR [Peltigera leucophlebia]
MPSLTSSAILLVLVFLAISAESKDRKPCTIVSPVTEAYYDLNTIAVQPLIDHKPAHKDDKKESWHARGYDYGTNFTLNFCRPVIEDLQDVVGVHESHWKNVSAFYRYNDKVYSIGQQSSELIFRGRKLVLNYTGGSPCETKRTKVPRRIVDDGDDKKDDDSKKGDNKKGDDKKGDDKKGDDKKGDDKKGDDRKDDDKDHDGEDKIVRRKSTIISFLCERDSLAPKAHLSFVGASEDECTYFFEAKAMAACGGVSQVQQPLGPGGVFGVIALITAAVYLIGGIAYQRTVMHQRGWRQIPNYAMWAGIGNFLYDIFIILTSSCARLIPRRQGYNKLPTHTTRNRNSRAEDENRLIDQLDEEWDD